jgi:hypothetical protein
MFNTIYSQRPGHVLHLSAWPLVGLDEGDGM